MLLLGSAVQYEVVYAVAHSLECYHDTVSKELHVYSSASSSHPMYFSKLYIMCHLRLH